MKLAQIITVFGAVAPIIALPILEKVLNRFICDTEPDQAFLSTISEIARKEELEDLEEARIAPSNVTINTYFHMISDSPTEEGKNNTKISKQMEVLNKIYGNYGFQFRLVGTDFSANKSWVDDDDRDGMKKALRKGTYQDYNVYFMDGLEVMGSCTLPKTINATDPNSFYPDGCVIKSGTMPGGKLRGVNQGKTLIHETGHWLGLLHTFEGYNCTGSGDMISDTPAQLFPTALKCPKSQDTCPDQPGQDNYHNYMDYSNE